MDQHTLVLASTVAMQITIKVRLGSSLVPESRTPHATLILTC